MRYVSPVITRKVSRQLLKARKNSPTILFAAGITGFVATTVLASRATLKLPTLVETAEAEARRIAVVGLDTEGYTEADHDIAMKRLQAKVGVSVVKLYAPAVITGAFSIVALTASHKILLNRQTQLTAAYAALDAAYRKYRQRVEKEIGPEKNAELMNDYEVCEIEDPKRPGKNAVEMRIGGTNSPYAKVFDSSNPVWQPSFEQNYHRLRIHEKHWNDKLIARGHVFLNEIYDDLGFDHTTAGATVGWFYNNPSEQGDNYISFGLDAPVNTPGHFARGVDHRFILDFNVDGVIYELMKKDF